MTKDELVALSALVFAETMAMSSENLSRFVRQEAMAYSDSQIFDSDAVQALRAELRKLGILPCIQ